MTGVAVGEKDRAGGKQVEEANDWFRLDDDPVVTVGDTVEPHGTHTPAPTMVEGEEWFLVDLQLLQSLPHLSERFLIEATSGLADVNQALLVVIEA